MAGPGGYDEGYAACSCFWGREPGRLVRRLVELAGSMNGLRILDAGCGEGKNAHFLARLGADVLAVDVSELALANAQLAWRDSSPGQVAWAQGSIENYPLPASQFDVVVAYGLLHCLESESAITQAIRRLAFIARPQAWLVLCAFNARSQELDAHEAFQPTLLAHDVYLQIVSDSGFKVLESTDEDLTETHPHNQISHTHSMTRIIARRSK